MDSQLRGECMLSIHSHLAAFPILLSMVLQAVAFVCLSYSTSFFSHHILLTLLSLQGHLFLLSAVLKVVNTYPHLPRSGNGSEASSCL